MDIVKGEQSYDPPIFDISELSEFNIQKSDDSDDENIFEMEDGDNSLIVKKGYKVVLKKGKTIQKDFTTQTGKPMTKESLESDKKDLTDMKDSGKKMIKASELSDIIKSDHPNLTDEDIQDIQTLVKDLNKIKNSNMSKLISQEDLSKAYAALGLSAETVVEKVIENPQEKQENIILKSDQAEPVTVTETTAPAAAEVDILDIVKGDINDRFTALQNDLGVKFTAIATLMKGNLEAFQAVERRFEQVEQSPASNRKSIERVTEGIKVIEKGFNNGSPLSAGQEEDKNVISKATPAGKNTILGLLEKAAMEGGENSESLLDKIITFESAGRLDAQTVTYLNEKFKVNIQ